MEPTTNLPTPESNDEIDLKEVWNAIWRRRYWPLGGLLIGLVIGAVSFVSKSDRTRYSVAVTFDLTKLPRKDNQCQIPAPDLDLENSQLIYTKQFMARITGLIPEYIPKKQANNWVVTPIKVNSINKKNGNPMPAQVECFVTLKNDSSKSKNQALQATESLGPLIKAVKEDIYEKESNPAKEKRFASAIKVEEVKQKISSSRNLALGGLAGLVAGTGLGLFADRRSGKEYSKDQLKRFLPYITALELPALPWDDSTAQQAIASLDAVLDPAKSWLLTSIGSSHPAVSLLKQALITRKGELSITTQPPLLSHPLPRYQDWLNQGLLIVVEPGFNTRSALQQTQQLLGQLPQTVDCRLVMVGTPTPSDCASTS